MSRPKQPFYYTAKCLAADVLQGRIAEDSTTGVYIRTCVQAVLDRTAAMDNGKIRLQCIDESIRKRNRYTGGIALKLNICERNVVKYTSDFIYAVAAELGFWKGG